MSDLTLAILKSSVTKSGALQKLSGWEEAAQKYLFGGEAEGGDKLPKSAQKLINKDNCGELFAAAREEIERIEPIHLAVPFPVSAINSSIIFMPWRKDDTTLLEIAYKPELIGGCTVGYKGKYADYSVKKKLEEAREEVKVMTKLWR